jgi:RNA polymerase sigma-70 factor, ECF subfamily
MDLTRASLLSRVRNSTDEAAWREFEALYHDLLVRFCRRRGLQEADAADVVQTVMTNLVKALPRFAYDPKRGRFRDYLYRCTDHAIARWATERNRAGRPTPGTMALVTAAEEPVDRGEAWPVWEEEWMAHHYRLAMKTIRQTFETRSVEVFDRSIAGETVAELAAATGMSEQAVHKVRQRIKARMEELIAAQIAAEDDAG